MLDQDPMGPVGQAAALPLHNGCSAWSDLVDPWRNMPLPGFVASTKDLLQGKLIGTKCKFCEHIYVDEMVVLVALAAKKLSNVIEVVEKPAAPTRLV